jgi:diguanylate cyclase (GGDEF)-like protein
MMGFHRSEGVAMHASASAGPLPSGLAVNGTSVAWLVDRQGSTVWSTSPTSSTFAHLGSLAGVHEASDRIHRDDLPAAERWWRATQASPKPVAATLRVASAGGSWLTVEVEGHHLGSDVGILVTVLDVTRRARAERWLAACNDLLGDLARDVPAQQLLDRLVRLVEEEIHDSRCTVMLATPDQQYLFVGAAPAFPPSLGRAIGLLPIEKGVGTCGAAAWSRRTVVADDISADERWDQFAALATEHRIKACWSTPFFGGDDEAVLGTFAIYFERPRAPLAEEVALLHDAGRVAALVCQAQASREALRSMALTDALTGLGNRNACRILLDQARVEATVGRLPFAVVALDLDDFGVVNDSLGHEAGDHLLRVVAQRLVSVAGARGQVVRPGGDEFVVVLQRLEDVGEAERLVTQLHQCLAQPVDVLGHWTHVRVSSGLAVLPPDAAEEPLAAAVLAMTVASSRGGGQSARYTPRMQEVSDDYFVLVTDLRAAIEAEQLTEAYEPVVDLSTRAVVRLEALARWPHPIRGMVPPASFIPVAERSGLIVELGAQVLRRSCRHLAGLRAQGHDVGMSVNVSVRQLLDPGLTAVVADALDAVRLPPEALTLELTESVLIEEDPRARESLAGLHRLGVRISVDDFGTGYSSLSYLRRFRFDELKLDHAFIAEIADEARARSMVASVVGLGQALGIPVVAEGVETEEQAAALVDMGCPLAQGWLFADLAPGQPPVTAG